MKIRFFFICVYLLISTSALPNGIRKRRREPLEELVAPEEETENFTPGPLWQDRIDQVEAHLTKLEERIEGLEQKQVDQRLHVIETEILELKESLESLHGTFNSTRENHTSELGKYGANLTHIHGKLLQMHEQHTEELSSLRDRHESLHSSFSEVHETVSHISRMHNVTEHLMNTADLILQERWYEASLQWTFNENHVVHDPRIGISELINSYLREVVRFAYCKGEPLLATEITQEERDARIARLIPIIKFVHKLSFNEYKVYAYQTFIQQLLSDDIFDGSEIFILADYVRTHYGINSKGQRHLSQLATTVASRSYLNVLYLDPSTEQSVDHNNTESDSEPLVRRRKRASSPRKIVTEKPEVVAEFKNALYLHIHGKENLSRKEAQQSFKLPVYASGSGKQAVGKAASSWSFRYMNNGYFAVKNSLNQGYLNVRDEEAADDRGIRLLGTVSDLDVDMYNQEFKLVLIDQETIGIENRKTGAPVVAVSCREENSVRPQSPRGEGHRVEKQVCFTVQTMAGGRVNSRRNWQGAKFTVKELY